jgi:hypothetical protein
MAEWGDGCHAIEDAMWRDRYHATGDEPALSSFEVTPRALGGMRGRSATLHNTTLSSGGYCHVIGGHNNFAHFAENSLNLGGMMVMFDI